MVEYASADAVRRGGGAGHKPRKKSVEGHSEGHSRSRKKRDVLVGDEANEKDYTATTITNSKLEKEKRTVVGRGNDTFAKSKGNNGMRTRKSRPAPGAALALAKREQVAIVPSQGRRITFDD